MSGIKSIFYYFDRGLFTDHPAKTFFQIWLVIHNISKAATRWQVQVNKIVNFIFESNT